MAGTPLPFPATALPGRRPGESQGDLLNAYVTKVGDEIRWHRVAGLRRVTPGKIDASRREPRGQLAVGNYLVSAWTDSLEAMDPAGGIAVALGDVLAGAKPVTMAANIRDIPQIAIVTESDAYLFDTDTMTLVPYPLTDVSVAQDGSEMVDNLGSVNSVDYYAGYLVFSRGDGTIVASDLQNAIIPDLSYDRAQYAADGLLRMKSTGETILAMGTKSIEVWQDVGKIPFPLQRATVIDTGLLGQFAVAGGPSEWERGILFVASDFTVRQLDGYTPRIVSNDAVSRDIYDARNLPGEFRAQVYSFGGQAIWSLSHLEWTWEYNLSTGAWHRRQSQGWKRWRGGFAREFNLRWYVQDMKSDGILEVTSDVCYEDETRLLTEVTSSALKDFPLSVRVPDLEFDFTVGLGDVMRPEAEQDPVVALSWSHDGGATWSSPLMRSLGQQGRYGTLVRLRNIGKSTHHGVMFKWSIIDPVHVTFRGAVAPTLRPVKPRAVAVS